MTLSIAPYEFDADRMDEPVDLTIKLSFEQTGHGQNRVRLDVTASVPLYADERYALYRLLWNALRKENKLHHRAPAWHDLTKWDSAQLENDLLNGTKFATLCLRQRHGHPHGLRDLLNRIVEDAEDHDWRVTFTV